MEISVNPDARRPAPHVIELQQAEGHLARLVEEAAAGDRVVIARAGKPVAVLTAYAEAESSRTVGLPLWPGTVTGALSRRRIYDDPDG